MTSMDKAAIGWSIGIVAVAVAIALAGSSAPVGVVDTPVITQPAPPPAPTEPVEPPSVSPDVEEDAAMPDDDADMAAPEDDDADMAAPEDDDADMAAPEDTDTEAPAGPIIWEVVTPEGTSVPGCEEDDTCFMPSSLQISVGDTVHWLNNDVAAHTVTSGSLTDGLSGVFDSGLVLGGTVFAHTFEEPGTYDYFCLVHPWMLGIVTVE